ncbi:MAG: glycosyltransferase [Xanthomonadales bacterium]|nr:glycosyltransferase [Xanthomonadales bacterium]
MRRLGPGETGTGLDLPGRQPDSWVSRVAGSRPPFARSPCPPLLPGIWNDQVTPQAVDAAIDVVVLSLDRLRDTHECIDSVLEQDHTQVRLWVLDQGSEPATVASLRQRSLADGFAFVEVGRIGVAAGRNRGYRMGKAPLIVALDNDAVLSDTGVLTRVAQRFATNAKLGVLAFAVHDYAKGGPDMGSWSYPWPVASHFNREFLAARFCGAGHAVSGAAFAASPGYDEQLFFFGEELDLSWSLISLGYEIRYIPEIAVRHKSSQEQRINWAEGRYYYNVRNMLYLQRKYWHDPWMLLEYLLGYLVKGLWNGLTRPTIKGLKDGLRMQYQGKDSPVLGEAALAYVLAHEYAARGSAWQRFHREVMLRLSSRPPA